MKSAARRRILLIAVLLLAVAILGKLILIPAIRNRLQREVAEQIEGQGGIVVVRYTGPQWLLRIASDGCREKYLESSGEPPALPEAWRDGLSYIGIDALVRIHDVADTVLLDDYSPSLKPKDFSAMLSLLPRLSTIRAAHFKCILLKDSEKPDWNTLGQLPEIQSVSFQINSSVDDTFAAIANCKSLRRIHVYSSFLLEKVDAKKLASDASLKHLSGISQLEELHIRNGQVTDACISTLKKFANLKSIQLYDTRVSEEGLLELQSAFPGAKVSLGRESGLQLNGEPADSQFVGFDRLPGGFF